MKSALLVSESPDLFSRVRAVVVADGAKAFPGGAQFFDDLGRLFNVFDADDDPWLKDLTDIELRTPEGELFSAAPISGCTIECRWEDLFAATVKHFAELLPEPLWVIDESDIAWAAGEVDPARIQL